MKIKKILPVGVLPVYNTNVEKNRNFISSNGVVHKNCVIDSDYQGEVHIHLTKISGEEIVLNPGDKIVQFIPMPVLTANMILSETQIDDLYNGESERGTGGFGSTGVQ